MPDGELLPATFHKVSPNLLMRFPCRDHHVSSMGPDTSDAWHRMPRKILHPMPWKSDKSGFSDFRKSGFSEIRKSGKSENSDFRIQEIRNFGNRNSEIPENPKIRIFGCSDFPVFRKMQKSINPVKMASDVEFAYVELPIRNMVMEFDGQTSMLSTDHHKSAKVWAYRRVLQ